MTALTSREMECMRHLGEGLRIKDIAAAMNVKVPTIRQFKFSVAAKLGLEKPTDIALLNAVRSLTAAVNEHTAAPVETPQPEWPLSIDIFEIAQEYPGKIDVAQWKAAELNINARIRDGFDTARLRKAALMYRRQWAAQTRRAIEDLMRTGLEEDQAKRRAKPIAIELPERFFDIDGLWRSSFPLPAYVEVPTEHVPGADPASER